MTSHTHTTSELCAKRAALIEAATAVIVSLKEIKIAGADIRQRILDHEIEGTDMDVAELLSNVRCQIEAIGRGGPAGPN
jgi:hypothetical protein